MPENESQQLSRREWIALVIKGFGSFAVASVFPEQLIKRSALKRAAKKIPEWVDEVETDEDFVSLVKLCADLFGENSDMVLDMLDLDINPDLETALGFVFTYLLDNGIDPEPYLIMHDFLQ